MNIKLLAVDLAWLKSGYAVIDQNLNIIETGIHKPHGVRKKDKLQNKVQSVTYQNFMFFNRLVSMHAPTHIYYEITDWVHGHAGQNRRVLTALGRAEGGAILAFLLNSDILPKIESIGASEVQKEIGANKGKRVKGDAHKAKIAKFVCDKFGLLKFTSTGQALFESRALSFDETDALAIAYVAMNRIKKETIK